MRVVSARIENYKSFRFSGEVRLAPGFNVIVGQNNVGKTALAEALGLRFLANPHRSRASVPVPGTNPAPISSAELSVRVDEEELRRILLSEERSSFHVPSGTYYDDARYGWAARFYELLEEGLIVQITYSSQTDFASGYGTTYEGRLQGLADEGESREGSYLSFSVDPKTGAPVFDPPNSLEVDPGSGDFATFLSGILRGRIYGFSAVRFGISDNPVGPDPNLAPDASNLVQALNLLYNGNPSRWRRYVEGVRTVLPQIKAITFSPTRAETVRLLLWNVDPDTEREDLAVPLPESGTGVGQVLAILYVAFASALPRTIIIDEPQSFLHPGAVRKLLEILKGYPQHQYVVTTHSPNAVTAADPHALFLVRKEGEESAVEQLDVSRARDQARFLREVGASLADVFGADEVLWVEGPTEEECFPLILSTVAGRPLLGTKVVGVLSVGDLEGRRSRDIYRIYRRLTEAGGLVPPAVGFVFDREGRDEKEREDLERESGGLVAFLPRRMYENYLLSPGAIAEVVSRTEGSPEGGVAAAEVEGWIEKHGRDRKYLGQAAEGPLLKNPSWLAEVHAARLLEDLFDDLSESRAPYRKVPHGAALTRWLCDNAPQDLREVADLIDERLDRGVASGAEEGAA